MAIQPTTESFPTAVYRTQALSLLMGPVDLRANVLAVLERVAVVRYVIVCARLRVFVVAARVAGCERADVELLVAEVGDTQVVIENLAVVCDVGSCGGSL